MVRAHKINAENGFPQSHFLFIVFVNGVLAGKDFGLKKITALIMHLNILLTEINPLKEVSGFTHP